MTRVLVTGGTGFIAGWCIAQLLEAGHEVVATIRAPEREPEVRAAVATLADADARLTFAVADLSRDDGWDDAMSECEYVLHVASPFSVAGEDSDSVISQACDGTLRVLEAASRSGIARVVVTSSCAAATPPSSQLSGTVDEECWTDADEAGLATYRRSKVLAEHAAWDYMASGPRRGAFVDFVRSDRLSLSPWMWTFRRRASREKRAARIPHIVSERMTKNLEVR